MSTLANALAERLGPTGRLTILTGAGISAESGIPTFRDSGGLWEQYSLDDVATPEAYARNPELVLQFYNARRRKLHEVEPNPGHFALARIEELLGDRFLLITQNIDDLHERAGSRRVLHMHGELFKVRCVGCGGTFDWRDDVSMEDSCFACHKRLRPHIVWFGEMPFYMDDEIPEALTAEAFLSVGTSGTVYPAAGFVATARAQGSLCVEVNLEPSDNAELFDLQLTGKSGELLPGEVAEFERLIGAK